MSAGVLFDTPGPATRARHRTYGVLTAVALVALAAWVVWRLNETGQLEYDKWEPFLTPRYIEAIIVDGLLITLQMAFSAVIGALVFGVLFGVGKLSDHRWVRWPCWLVVEFFRNRGVGEMWTSAGEGEGSPITFYERYGFERTGELHGNEILLRLEIS